MNEWFDNKIQNSNLECARKQRLSNTHLWYCQIYQTIWGRYRTVAGNQRPLCRTNNWGVQKYWLHCSLTGWQPRTRHLWRWGRYNPHRFVEVTTNKHLSVPFRAMSIDLLPVEKAPATHRPVKYISQDKHGLKRRLIMATTSWQSSHIMVIGVLLHSHNDYSKLLPLTHLLITKEMPSFLVETLMLCPPSQPSNIFTATLLSMGELPTGLKRKIWFSS